MVIINAVIDWRGLLNWSAGMDGHSFVSSKYGVTNKVDVAFRTRKDAMLQIPDQSTYPQNEIINKMINKGPDFSFPDELVKIILHRVWHDKEFQGFLEVEMKHAVEKFLNLAVIFIKSYKESQLDWNLQVNNYLKSPDVVQIARDDDSEESLHEIEREKEFLEEWIEKCLIHIHSNYETKSSNQIFSSAVVRKTFGKFLVNRLIFPAIEKLTAPFFLNNIIIKQANEYETIHQLAKTFRQTLEFSLGFPPSEFQNSQQWSMRSAPKANEKLKYAESLFKSAKRCKTLPDAKAVRFSLLMEINLVQQNMSGDFDFNEKYLKLLQHTLQKYDKRIMSIFLTHVMHKIGTNILIFVE
jgi:hypothetical protein